MPRARSVLPPDIVARLQRRDPAAFDEILTKTGPSLVAFMVSYVHSRDTAQDLLQDILFRLFERGDRFHPRETVEAYLFTAARNAALTWLRNTGTYERYREQYVRDAFLVTEPLPGSTRRDEQVAALHRALATLTEHQRTAFHLRYSEEMTVAEIAQVLEITSKGVEALLTRIKKLLTDHIVGPIR